MGLLGREVVCQPRACGRMPGLALKCHHDPADAHSRPDMPMIHPLPASINTLLKSEPTHRPGHPTPVCRAHHQALLTSIRWRR